MAMTTMFFAFPRGVAGLALLLLRLSIVAFLVASPAMQGDFGPLWLPFRYILAVLLVAGLATRIAAVLCVVAAALVAWSLDGAPWLPLLVHALDAAALALIGPGAWSIDAMNFGRRTMHLPG